MATRPSVSSRSKSHRDNGNSYLTDEADLNYILDTLDAAVDAADVGQFKSWQDFAAYVEDFSAQGGNDPIGVDLVKGNHGKVVEFHLSLADSPHQWTTAKYLATNLGLVDDQGNIDPDYDFSPKGLEFLEVPDRSKAKAAARDRSSSGKSATRRDRRAVAAPDLGDDLFDDADADNATADDSATRPNRSRRSTKATQLLGEIESASSQTTSRARSRSRPQAEDEELDVDETGDELEDEAQFVPAPPRTRPSSQSSARAASQKRDRSQLEVDPEPVRRRHVQVEPIEGELAQAAADVSRRVAQSSAEIDGATVSGLSAQTAIAGVSTIALLYKVAKDAHQRDRLKALAERQVAFDEDVATLHQKAEQLEDPTVPAQPTTQAQSASPSRKSSPPSQAAPPTAEPKTSIDKLDEVGRKLDPNYQSIANDLPQFDPKASIEAQIAALEKRMTRLEQRLDRLEALLEAKLEQQSSNDKVHTSDTPLPISDSTIQTQSIALEDKPATPSTQRHAPDHTPITPLVSSTPGANPLEDILSDQQTKQQQTLCVEALAAYAKTIATVEHIDLNHSPVPLSHDRFIYLTESDRGTTISLEQTVVGTALEDGKFNQQFAAHKPANQNAWQITTDQLSADDKTALARLPQSAAALEQQGAAQAFVHSLEQHFPDRFTAEAASSIQWNEQGRPKYRFDVARENDRTTILGHNAHKDLVLQATLGDRNNSVADVALCTIPTHEMVQAIDRLGQVQDAPAAEARRQRDRSPVSAAPDQER
ncbi:hypothetical protein H6F67_25745 [Microcoleus sp. FACHB-1515]|uniref:hypothetical protein n=1 Tax=Cyanophyceae TaxID=3028117 RepID=UPI001689B972|nr:hypothetical protein [Microcoleus sp. FACHB-1515]MBD2093252.1 hypothetical protein [Microcoleus sp. FACHB-1515]